MGELTSDAVDGAAVDGAAVDGAAVDGAAVDGAAVDGAAVDGAAGAGGMLGATVREHQDQVTKPPEPHPLTSAAFDAVHEHWRELRALNWVVIGLSAAYLLRQWALSKQVHSVASLSPTDFTRRRRLPVKIAGPFVCRGNGGVYARVLHVPPLIPSWLLAGQLGSAQVWASSCKDESVIAVDEVEAAGLWLRLFGASVEAPDSNAFGAQDCDGAHGGVIPALYDTATRTLVAGTRAEVQLLFVEPLAAKKTKQDKVPSVDAPKLAAVGHLLFRDHNQSWLARLRHGRDSTWFNYCLHFVKTGRVGVKEDEMPGRFVSHDPKYIRELSDFIEVLIASRGEEDEQD